MVLESSRSLKSSSRLPILPKDGVSTASALLAFYHQCVTKKMGTCDHPAIQYSLLSQLKNRMITEGSG